tara:strand:+ start:532 stop:1074 length:543 start_codon:yes stop_codon:yes gene_type:complete
LIKKASFVKSAEYEKDFPEPLSFDIVMVGRSNVGKSSLINRLTNDRKLARVSKTPGCTKLINFFRINNKFYIVDLPGYGFAKVPPSIKKKWGSIIENYLRSARKKIILILVDSKRGLEIEEEQMIEWLNYNSVPFEIVFTKIDKIKRNKLREMKKKISGIFVSSSSGEGMDNLFNVISQQ